MSILHFNENIGRPIATKEGGEIRTRTVVPLATGEWTMKVVLEQQTFHWRRTILHQIFDERRKKAAETGHRMRGMHIISAPTLVSTVPRENADILLSNLRKRRHMD